MLVTKRTVDISKIEPRVIHNRRDGLLEDIEKNGLKNRIWLKKSQAPGNYFIRDGRHRFCCCRKLGMTKIPSVISK
jgi:ParB-like chromosome segregation protein Spo0J